jgi:hypothetical protein
MAASPSGNSTCSYTAPGSVAATSAPPPPPPNCTQMLNATARAVFDQCLEGVAQLCAKAGDTVDLSSQCTSAVPNSTVSWSVDGLTVMQATCPSVGSPLSIIGVVTTNTVSRAAAMAGWRWARFEGWLRPAVGAGGLQPGSGSIQDGA